MYVGFEQITVSDTALTHKDLTVPKSATHAEIQADTQDVRYTMLGDSGVTPTQAIGMLFVAKADPKSFLIEDVKRMTFIRGAGSDAKLNIHYFGGRIIT